ncbi:MAG: AraC family transcriptional regulator ligand-binding domain-containing protein [Myxococcales bacterium]
MQLVSMMLVRGLASELHVRGADVDALLKRLGLRTDALCDPRGTVPNASWEQLVSRAFDLTLDPLLGLAVGARVAEGTSHVVSALVASRPTLRDAFVSIERYGILISGSRAWHLLERDDVAQLCLEADERDDLTARFEIDCTLAFAHQALRRLAPEFSPGNVSMLLRREVPAAFAQAFAQRAHCDAQFGRERHALVFPRALLDRSQFLTDKLIEASLMAAADKLLAGLPLPQVEDRVRASLRAEPTWQEMNLDVMARLLRMTPRALRRGLASEGTSFSLLLDQERRRAASELLSEPDCSIDELSERLGFSERSAFYRAFRRWTGQTPWRFRQAIIRAPFMAPAYPG